MSDIFKAPSGTPKKKPSNIMQYPDFPALGKAHSGMVKKNSITIQPPSGKSVR